MKYHKHKLHHHAKMHALRALAGPGGFFLGGLSKAPEQEEAGEVEEPGESAGEEATEEDE